MSWYDDNEAYILDREMSKGDRMLESLWKQPLKHTFTNRNGDEVIIEEMSDRYLENTIRYIIRNGDKYGKLNYFQAEKARRQKNNIKIEE